jgi:hypothetical protein
VAVSAVVTVIAEDADVTVGGDAMNNVGAMVSGMARREVRLVWMQGPMLARRIVRSRVESIRRRRCFRR